MYLTTLLDTFLNDTTKFILLLHPRAIGAKQAITLEAVLQARTTIELVNAAAEKKTREMGFLSFTARLDFLRSTFGLDLGLDEAAQAQLEHYSTLRNTVIHDQGVFECSLDNSGRIAVQQRTCLAHPVAVTIADVRAAEGVYRSVVWAVCRAVVEQVLKGAEHPAYQTLAKTLGQPLVTVDDSTA